ncbi:MAG: MFS transporter [Chloroflexota bacterium]
MNITKKFRGVFYGWWMIIAAIVMNMTVGGVTLYGFTAFYNPIVAEMGWTRAQTALAFSLRSIEGGIIMPIVGLFVDRMGVRKCVFIGLLIIGAAFILMSRLSSLPTFYTAFMLMALGNTMFAGIPQYTAVANWFRRKRSRAMGVLSAGFGISGVMAPVLVFLINRYGWRSSLFGLALGIWAIGLPLSMFMRHRPEPYGLLPDGDKPGDPPVEETGTATAPGRSRYAHLGSSGSSLEEGLTLKEALRTRNFYLLMCFNAFSAIVMSSMSVLVIPHLTSAGVAEGIAAFAVTGITTSSLIGRVGFGSLGDTHNKKLLLVIAVLMRAIGVFIFANIHSAWMIIPFLLMYGPGFGAPIPLVQAIQADCFGTKNFASIRGMMALGHTVFGVTAPLFAGWIYDVQGSYRLAFMIFAVISSLAIPAIMMVKVPAPKKDTVAIEKAAV